jgi:hypothetical protein
MGSKNILAKNKLFTKAIKSVISENIKSSEINQNTNTILNTKKNIKEIKDKTEEEEKKKRKSI